MKRTYQPKRRKRARAHGFRTRMSTRAGRLTVEAAARVSGSARRPKRGRLSRSAEFERVYRQGRALGNRHLVLYVFPRGEASPAAPELSAGPRMGLSVSRKVG